MQYKDLKPCEELSPFIHSYWELKGEEQDGQWERIFPDGCAGFVVNLGDTCLTDNGSVSMDFGKTYAVGAMTSFKDNFISSNTRLLGVCLKPAAFSNFYHYAAQDELTDITVEFDKSYSFDIDKIIKDPEAYFNRLFLDRSRNKHNPMQAVLNDIHSSQGQAGIYEIAAKNSVSVRQLERHFKTQTGITPKEYSNIIRFQNALAMIKNSDKQRSMSDIAFECGFYDHAHLANEIRRHAGLSPSQL